MMLLSVPPLLRKGRLSLLAFLLCSSRIAGADVLLDEPFSYPNGALVEVSGGTWIHHSPTSSHTGEVQVVDGHIELSYANYEDVSVRIPGQPYPAMPGTELFARFHVNFKVLPSSSGAYFAHFKDSGNIFRARVWALTSGAPAGSFRLGLSSTGSSLAVIHPQVLALGTDYTIVLRVSTATGAATLWIDPTNETDPSITAEESVSGFNAVAFAFRETSGMGGPQIDDLRIATTFEEVLGTEPPPPPPTSGAAAFSVVTYNTHGNHVEDWSTNSAQVRAIGRQMQFLDPDIITFQEIPFTNTWQMTNFVAAFRPGYSLAANSGTDGFIRSVILSRFPITRSTKWLDGVSLAAFGYNGWFTRDLFEAEIQVPGFSQPLHVFTTHLKALEDSESVARRAAEARAISNFFAVGFLSTNALHPYLLTGDLNEDIFRPSNGSGQPVKSLVNPGTGLRLLTPLNPQTRSDLTISIRDSNLSRRFDYILPGALLATNLVSSEVFRTDLAGDIAPALAADDVTASDHLPVLATFSNPYFTPFRIRSLTVSNQETRLTWESIPGGRYRIEGTTNLSDWTLLVTNLTAEGQNASFVTNSAGSARWFRIRIEP